MYSATRLSEDPMAVAFSINELAKDTTCDSLKYMPLT